MIAVPSGASSTVVGEGKAPLRGKRSPQRTSDPAHSPPPVGRAARPRSERWGKQSVSIAGTAVVAVAREVLVCVVAGSAGEVVDAGVVDGVSVAEGTDRGVSPTCRTATAPATTSSTAAAAKTMRCRCCRRVEVGLTVVLRLVITSSRSSTLTSAAFWWSMPVSWSSSSVIAAPSSSWRAHV